MPNVTLRHASSSRSNFTHKIARHFALFQVALPSQDLLAEDDATMATDDEMRERLQSLETKFDRLEKKVDRLEKKVDQLPTKADLSGFATKAHLVAFTDAITDKMGIMLGDAKDSVKKAAEGYGGTLERIERELNEFRSEWRNKSDDTDRVLTDHALARVLTGKRMELLRYVRHHTVSSVRALAAGDFTSIGAVPRKYVARVRP